MLIKRYTILALLVWILLACEGCSMEQYKTAEGQARNFARGRMEGRDLANPEKSDLIQYGLGLLALVAAEVLRRKIGTIHERISKHKAETRAAAAAAQEINGGPDDAPG